MSHRIDHAKYREGLEKRGWALTSKGWEHYSNQASRDEEEAYLEAIVCTTETMHVEHTVKVERPVRRILVRLRDGRCIKAVYKSEREDVVR